MAPTKWLWDMFQEWLVVKGYALESWVLAKDYATETWVKEQIAAMRDYLLSVINALECFVDRGDPASYDWTQATLIQDGAWHDLDCSAIVPADAKTILFRVYLRHPLINKDFYIRTKGNANYVNIFMQRTQVANISIVEDAVVACDTNRKVQYWISGPGWTSIRITVGGWWF